LGQVVTRFFPGSESLLGLKDEHQAILPVAIPA
jgi:hypothetical protein